MCRASAAFCTASREPERSTCCFRCVPAVLRLRQRDLRFVQCIRRVLLGPAFIAICTAFCARTAPAELCCRILRGCRSFLILRSCTRRDPAIGSSRAPGRLSARLRQHHVLQHHHIARLRYREIRFAVTMSPNVCSEVVTSILLLSRLKESPRDYLISLRA